MKNELNKITILSRALIKKCPIEEGRYESYYILPTDRDPFEIAQIIKRVNGLYENAELYMKFINKEVLEELKELEVDIKIRYED
jgi:hypothetical protein